VPSAQVLPQVPEHYALELRLGQRVEKVEGSDAVFASYSDEQGKRQNLTPEDCGRHRVYDFDRVGVPGEDLPHVLIYPSRTPSGSKTLVIGGKNSAAEAALDSTGQRASDSLHRRAELGSTIKYWVRPDIEND